MKIPSQFKEILDQNDLLNAAVHTALSVTQLWFEDNKLVFFPEYTDHGPRHIQDVLDTTEALIPNNAWGILSPEDIATLVLGILLHDCAMHLSEDGFVTLISEDRPHNVAFKEKPWPQLWQEFMAEARRFDERKLKALFDDIEPIQTPPLDPIKMTKRDRLLIGEFLRRHHPRLAHEIAVSGIPGPQDEKLSLGESPQNIKELAGVVARSHGLDLRICIDYLNSKSKWGARRTTGIHVTYLMVLVRIADYLQIQSERARGEILKIRSLKSPISRGEWTAHAAVKDIHQETDDPEAFWIEAAPEDVRTYLKLRNLLKDIQRELDDSWAVLGEVYGPKPELRNLGLTIRRIKSNLDDVETFAKTVRYIPRPASLEAVGADLLKLLIEPLYGQTPEIGIRELLQNAVDACRELKDYVQQHPEIGVLELPEQEADILITLEAKGDGTKWFVIRDRGIGMTTDTLLNYFLKAGASFRNSNAWRKQHEDEEGRARVLRSGRFGIGVLAGFLLGEEIQVSTRHITACPDEGITFTCKLIDESIELMRITRAVGTTIQIQVTDEIFSTLQKSSSSWEDGYVGGRWDWYCLREPSISRIILPEEERLQQKYEMPAHGSPLPRGWRRINSPNFQEIHWSYLDKEPILACNGILIAAFNEQYSEWDLDINWDYSEFGQPTVSVFDPSGKLPLNLQRTALSVKEYPFNAELLEDITRDFLAYIIVNAPESRLLLENAQFYKSFKYKGLSKRYWYWYASDGISLITPWHLQQLKESRLLYLPVLENSEFKEKVERNSTLSVIPHQQSAENMVEWVFSRTWDNSPKLGWIYHKGIRLVADRKHLERLKRKSNNFDSIDRHIVESLGDNLVLLEWGYCPPADPDEEELFSISKNGLFPIATVCVDGHVSGPNESYILKAWQELIRLPYIPYNLNERREKLDLAYKELSPYIQVWQEIKNNNT